MKSKMAQLTSLVAFLLAGESIALAADKSTNTPAATADKASPNRFYGAISKIDTNKNAFTVGDQTYVITAESQVTNKDGEKAKLSDAVVGEPARGTYTKRSDGTLNVTKVRFGKKANSKGGGSGKGGGKKKTESESSSQSKQP
jgi:hypothetical protein